MTLMKAKKTLALLLALLAALSLLGTTALGGRAAGGNDCGTNGAVRRGLRTHARRSIFTHGTHRRIPARTGRNSCAGGNTSVGTA